jgi:hypothetical protein
MSRADVCGFGDAHCAAALFCDLAWTVRDGEAWAVVDAGPGKKTAILEVRYLPRCLSSQQHV